MYICRLIRSSQLKIIRDELLSVLTAISMADELKKTVENAKKQLLRQSSAINDARSMDFAEKQLQQIQKNLRDQLLF